MKPFRLWELTPITIGADPPDWSRVALDYLSYTIKKRLQMNEAFRLWELTPITIGADPPTGVGLLLTI